ncbi:MerR family transcriptional regulator [Vibrio ostreae]|uniref:MerR family transcriptional regulator n=1 Tax=Vibrio ostreae TaxID=2841925 RepID=A0A975U9P7_9VIBR|nr:MerR family transcriptional regulator [Vibrio ostreae]QXO16514.1 MerR family transcriptional regulator [Vibrio ostreae]
MNMKQFSHQVGLSPHTLRYYEKIGLLKNIRRDASGHRSYTAKDIDWITFIIRLKETGMPLEGILEYANYRDQGSATVGERQHLLEQHRAALQQHIEQQTQHLLALEAKIELYKNGKVA